MKARKKRKTALERHLGAIAVKGGQAVLKKYGKSHFSSMARRRWEDKRD